MLCGSGGCGVVGPVSSSGFGVSFSVVFLGGGNRLYSELLYARYRLYYVLLCLFLLCFSLPSFVPEYMPNHVLYVLRSFCPVTYVACPFLCSCIVVHVVL